MHHDDFFESDQGVSRPDRKTVIAFALLVLIGGSNAVAVRFSNLELPPFWGAAIRFVSAAIMFWAAVLIRRLRLPKDRALLGSIFYGFLAVGVSYAFLYWTLLSLATNISFPWCDPVMIKSMQRMFRFLCTNVLLLGIVACGRNPPISFTPVEQDGQFTLINEIQLTHDSWSRVQ